MKLDGQLKVVSGDGKFMLEIEENGFALRRASDRSIILDGSTFFREEEITFAPRDFKIKHRRRMELDGKTLLYDYYQLEHKPVK